MSTPSLPAAPPCEYLEWDSNFFGLRIGRVVPRTLTESTVNAVLRWCAAERIDCLYFLADPTDGGSIRLAEDHRFRFVDTRVTLEAHLDAPRPIVSFPGTVRDATEEDIPALRQMARTGFRLSRFFFDPGFSQSKAESLYDIWIEKSCRGAAAAVLVADLGGDAVGYVTCQAHAVQIGQIGLLGVREDMQGHGIGRVLVTAASEWFARQGGTGVRVVTQARNRSALRVYGSCGFVVDAVELWYHRWF